MKARINNLSMKEIKTASGKSFKKVVIDASVVMNEKGEVRKLTCELSPEFFAKYFRDICGVKNSKDLIGKPCEAVVSSRLYTDKNGDLRDWTFIKYINLLDSDGKPIIPQKSENAKPLEW